MKINFFNYIERESPIHDMTGASKFACLLLWTLAAMTTFCTPFLVVMSVMALGLFKISKIKLKDVRALFYMILVLLFMSLFLSYLFAPENGVDIYGTRHVIFKGIGRFTLTQEQLLYMVNRVLKNIATVPLMLLFVSTTRPSEFAASLNKIGVSYRISYAVSLTLRYIPDIMSEYHDVAQAQQARGVELTSKQSLLKRMKSAAVIILPLILSSMDRIDTITNAMELRGFGRYNKRTWITDQKFGKLDYAAILLGFILMGISIGYTIWNGSRFYNPFI